VRPAPSLGAQRALALGRTLDACPDPVQLYAALTDDGRRRDTLLLESADPTAHSHDKSLLVTRAALRIVGRGREVEVTALSPNGESVLGWLEARLGERSAAGPPPELTRAPGGLRARWQPLGDERASEHARLRARTPLELVRAVVLEVAVEAGAAFPPLVAGAFAYDLLALYEELPGAASDPLGWPDLELLLAEELVIVQHKARRTTCLRFVYGGERAEQAYHDATAALGELVARAGAAGATGSPPEAFAALGQPSAAPATRAARVDLDDAAFASLVERLKEHIVRGDVFQIVPSRTFSLPCADPLSAYAALRALNPSPYMFFLSGTAGVLFGASPESALTVRRGVGAARRVTINPIAGTRARGRRQDGSIDADLDTRIEAELRLDDKEIAEHMMLVDLARNDVARVCEPGSRAVERLLDVVRYSHVMHLVSLVAGTLRPDLDALHAYVATMNMGTLVGAPKIKAAELLRRYEPSRRGAYGGAVGYLTAEGDLDTCIVIRSAVVQDGVAHVRAGAGVVYDSVPRAEADETRRKAEAVLAAIHP
jgi:anthranilate synthase component 1